MERRADKASREPNEKSRRGYSKSRDIDWNNTIPGKADSPIGTSDTAETTNRADRRTRAISRLFHATPLH